MATPVALKIIAAVASLTLSWHMSHPSGLSGFRVSWRPVTSPPATWSAPLELPRRARSTTIGNLNPQRYEVKVGALLAGGKPGGHAIGFGTPFAREEPPEPPAPVGAGQVRLVKDANSSFDAWDNASNAAWINEHFYRMTGYTPWFDKNLSWYPRARVYADAYGIYPDSALAREHPEWIATDRSGRRLWIPYACAGGSCMLYAGDISNPAFRNHWIAELAATLAKGYIGVFVDDVDMWANTSNGSGQLVPAIDHNTRQPMSDETWRGYLATFMQELRNATPGYEVTQNQVWNAPAGPSNARVAQTIGAADWIHLEFGVVAPWLNGGTAGGSLYALLKYCDEVHALGTAIDMSGYAQSAREMEYTLAGYFLINDGTDIVTTSDNQTVSHFWPGWTVELGAAQAARSRSADGLFQRPFTRGMVYLNEPGASAKTIRLARPMTNSSGQTVSSVTLAASSAAVLHY
jgi:hypothetical protein